MKRRIISFMLTLMLLMGTVLTGTVSVSAAEGKYYEPQPYVPSAEAKEVGLIRCFFLLPNEWKNDYTDSAGVYWWNGTDAVDTLLDGGQGSTKWPGYKIYQYSDEEVTMYTDNDRESGEAVLTGTVWYVDIPADVPTVVFNNALDGGDMSWDNFDEARYLSSYQTVNVPTEGIYPEDWFDGFKYTDEFFDTNNNMIYIIDPSKTSVSVTGKQIFSGGWYLYHGGDQWDNPDNPIYGGSSGKEPDYVEPPYVEPTVPSAPDSTEPDTTEPTYPGAPSEGKYYEPQPYVPSAEAKEVGLIRCFFLLPNEWKNEYTASAGVYWWSGTDAIDTLLDGGQGSTKWPGYKIYQYSDEEVTMYTDNDRESGEAVLTGTVWYIDIPADVPTIVFNNALDGGDKSWDNFDEARYLSAYQTVDVQSEGIWPEDGVDGFLTGDRFDTNDNMIYIIDPDLTAESVTGQKSFAGNWYLYHGGDQWDNPDNPIYGGSSGKEPDYVDPPYVDTPTPTEPTNPTTPTEPSQEPVSGEIYFEMPDNWKNVRTMYAHIWMCIDDGTVNWPAWKTRKEKMEYIGNGIWSYDTANAGPIYPDKGGAYAVIFTADIGWQTYTLIFGAENLGDTAYVTGNTFENPEDSNKYVIEARWRSGKYGPEKKILSTGKGIIGDTVPAGVTDAIIMANWLRAYYADSTKTTNVLTLLSELNVTGQEVYDELEKLVENDWNKDDILRVAAKLLLGYRVESIEVTKIPDTKFIAGDFYYIYDDLIDGMEVKVTYSNGTKKTYTYENDFEFFYYDLYFSAASIDKYGWFVPDLGENLITVTYNGKSTEFIIIGIMDDYDYILGDVDGDGDVSVKDATAIQMYLAGFLDETELDLDAADFDGDGDVSVKDATAIQMFLAGLSYA